ncbi:MAG TPA: hypothetical protein VMU19_15680 [Bryobacteraceae bacterium]|nr:hypothetical protein [Bryobacteraceae bacterium]
MCSARFLRLIGILSIPAGLLGQHLAIGLIGGGALTDAAQQQSADPQATGSSPHKDWLAGAAFEYRIAPRFSVEADGMYRLLNATVTQVELPGTPNHVYPENVVTWEFPLLAKYRFGDGKWQPFVEAGPEARTTGNRNFNPSHVGATAGVGLATRWRGFEIAPALRYTRWERDRYSSILGQTLFASRPNQVELLLGVSRTPSSIRSPLGRRFSLGPIAGWGLTRDFPSSTWGSEGTQQVVISTGLRSPLIGGDFEVALPGRFAVELDAFWKPIRSQSASYSGGQVTSAPRTFSATDFEFPLLAKRRFRTARAQPFLEGGPSFRRPAGEFGQVSKFGATAGAGVELKWRAARLEPAVRFTRWAADYPEGIYPQNEAYLALGVLLGAAAR